jgi:hypothetical protein
MHLRHRLSLCGIALPLLLGLAGCLTSRTYTVQVDAIAREGTDAPATPSGQSYHIRTRNPRLDEGSLRYKEVADYVRTALSGRGLYEAPSPEKADIVIEIDYGMEAPRIKFESLSNPVFVQMAGAVREEIIPVRDSSGNIMGYRTVVIQEPERNEFMGMQESIRPVLVHEKYLRLSARTNQESPEGRPAPEVWNIIVSTEDGGQELRQCIPVLASVTADYIGANTKEERPVKIAEGDEAVAFVKQGL